MKFNEAYYRLDQFFSGYFPDADFDNLTDEEVVAHYIDDCSKSKKSMLDLAQTKIEIELLISEIEIYWEEVMDSANRHFRNSNEALNWLKMIKIELNK